MKTLLRIDTSLRSTGSYSRDLGDFFLDEWKKKHQNHAIRHRDLSADPIPHLNQATLDGFYDHTKQTALLQHSDQLIAELFEADEILFTIPMYNYGIPSALKAYFDLVVRKEMTFTYRNDNPGLLKNKKAYVVSSMGDETKDEINLVEAHMQRILNQIGITEHYFFVLDGTSDQHIANQKSATLQTQIINLLNQ